MADLYFALKFVHILGAMVQFGTGLGIAFFMWTARSTRQSRACLQKAAVWW